MIWETIDSDKVYFTPSLVDAYLDINWYWWKDKENSLFNKREEARAVLLFWLENDREPDYDLSYEMLYVLFNFQNEFLRHFRKVIDERSGINYGLPRIR